MDTTFVGQDLILNPGDRLVLRFEDLPPVPILTWAEPGFEEPLTPVRRVRIMFTFEENKYCHELPSNEHEQAVLATLSSVHDHRL
ncbi:hypothetical protein [Methylobacterium oryzisoli]|uniref:hypothetical protein n=1 Tax=Methylobacterium oryzisoli TaxID=3385502 RepID=UPI00389193F4